MSTEKRKHKNRNSVAVPEETKRNDMRIPSGGDTLAGRNNKRQSTNYSDTRDGSAWKNKSRKMKNKVARVYKINECKEKVYLDERQLAPRTPRPKNSPQKGMKS